MKRIFMLLIFISFFQTISAGKGNERRLQPRLIIGIVVDQMRYDYLYRFYDQYTEKGFKRLLNEGMNFTFTQYNYIPTFTGPGHSSIYTGTTPYYHGIISNDWYDKKLKKTIYCVKDTDVKAVGADNTEGQMSPKNLLGTTMTDQLRMSNNGHSRVFSISLKDRAAILPGGHMANAAYWYDGKSGNFISSTYYIKELPAWVNDFNERKLPAMLMNSGWQLDSDKNYETSLPDNGPGEEDIFREGKTTFPHQFTKLSDTLKRERIKDTPFGNELLTDFLTELLKNEKPGQSKYCDFLAVSFSSTDYVGHAYGPNSMEVMDTYLKLDRQIARILDTLDRCVGKNNYLLFLTADHGVKPNSAYLETNRIDAGHDMTRSIREQLLEFCKSQFGTPLIIEAMQDNQIYLNHLLLDSLKINIKEIDSKLISFMRVNFPFMGLILTKEELITRTPARSMNSFILNGFNIRRSGDILFDLIQNYLTSGYEEKGTTHESSYDYDTHVPLIFFGWHIEKGESNREVFVEDIAPTITNLIHIQEPDATIGIPIVK
ncbi:MAG: alkaline phosphatase PafA [Bacteroidales bacterium]|jgi:predicted AlkP superfamily pyrophosphatase or phosphodiesterase